MEGQNTLDNKPAGDEEAPPPEAPNTEAAEGSEAAAGQNGEGLNATKHRKAAETKAEMVLKRLRQPKGVSIPALVEATCWQAHSVRGFLSGTVKKKLGLTLTSEVGKDGVRRYRIERDAKRA